MLGLQRWPKVKQLREKLNGKAKAEPTKPRKRKGLRRRRGKGLWAKVRAAQALTLDALKVPRQPAARRNAACLAQ